MRKHAAKWISNFAFAALAAVSLAAAGCATVPRESVDLSYALGEDIESLHQSYRELIKRYFETLRAQVSYGIDEVFVPSYIHDFVISGKLAQHVQNQRADLVEVWARVAVKRIDCERRERLQPLYDAKRELLTSVNEAFDRVERTNATITAHLNSVVRTQQAQDEMLRSVKLKDLREKISGALAEASEKAGRIAREINSANTKLEKIN